MVDQLINIYKQNNLERKMFLVYLKNAAIPIILYFILSFYFDLWIVLLIYFIFLLLIELIGIYNFMFKEIKTNYPKENLNYKNFIGNICKYADHEMNSGLINIKAFLKSKKIYNKSKILFLINSVRSRKRNKFQRDWFSLFVNASLVIIVGVIGKDNINFDLLNVIIYFIVLVTILYVAYKLIIWFYEKLIDVDSLDKIDNILSDIYLNLK